MKRKAEHSVDGDRHKERKIQDTESAEILLKKSLTDGSPLDFTDEYVSLCDHSNLIISDGNGKLHYFNWAYLMFYSTFKTVLQSSQSDQSSQESESMHFRSQLMEKTDIVSVLLSVVVTKECPAHWLPTQANELLPFILAGHKYDLPQLVAAGTHRMHCEGAISASWVATLCGAGIDTSPVVEMFFKGHNLDNRNLKGLTPFWNRCWDRIWAIRNKGGYNLDLYPPWPMVAMWNPKSPEALLWALNELEQNISPGTTEAMLAIGTQLRERKWEQKIPVHSLIALGGSPLDILVDAYLHNPNLNIDDPESIDRYKERFWTICWNQCIDIDQLLDAVLPWSAPTQAYAQTLANGLFHSMTSSSKNFARLIEMAKRGNVGAGRILAHLPLTLKRKKSNN